MANVRSRTAPTHHHMVRFMATDEERAAIEAAAIVRGVPLSQVIREGLRAAGIVRGDVGAPAVRRLA